MSAKTALVCPDGGIGRRNGFKHRREIMRVRVPLGVPFTISRKEGHISTLINEMTNFFINPEMSLDRAKKDYLFISRNKATHSNWAQAEEMAWTKLMEAVASAKEAGILQAEESSNQGLDTGSLV